MVVSDPRFNREKRPRLSARPWAESLDAATPGELPRWLVYQQLPVVAISDKPTTMETRRQADALFDIDAAADFGLFESHRSPPGSPKMSRLVPLPSLAKITESDPWTFDPDQPCQLVFLRRRGDAKDEITFDPADPIPSRIQQRLEQINGVNNSHRITYETYDEWDDRLCNPRRLRPVHYAIFTDDWDHHGRIYTGRYGHQSLRKIERQTITFNGQSSVELDYSAFHCRMLYHVAGINLNLDKPRTYKA